MKLPTFVAELSGNHLGQVDKAEYLCRVAKDVGADAVKLQTYDPERLVAPGKHSVMDGPWKGRDLRELYHEAWTPQTWQKRLFKVCASLGLACFSSPFSREDVDLLEDLNCPFYKIASFEITDLDLIQYAAQTGKPIIMSTGMATLGEIEHAVDEALAANAPMVVVLVCTSGYPTPLTEANVLRVADLIDYFGHDPKMFVGLSDHTLGPAAALAALARGACMVEKHLTIRRSDGGPDAAFSAEPEEFARVVRLGSRVREAIGRVSYGPTESEKPQLAFRRGLWVVKDVVRGGKFTRDNLRHCRPATPGIALDIRDFLGTRAKQEVKAGTPFAEALAE